MNEERVREIAREDGGISWFVAIVIISLCVIMGAIAVTTVSELQDAQRRIAVLEQRIQQLENRK